jgi:PTS system nitrogen regulatory IIA component
MNAGLVRVRDAAELLGVRESTIRSWVYDRKIPFRKINGAVRFSVPELEAWIDSQRVAPRAGTR